MRVERLWERMRLILLILFVAVIIFNIYTIYRNYMKVQNGGSLSKSEEAYDIKGEYLHDQSVLVISSYNPTYMIVPEEEDGIYDTLKAAGIGYEIEYMNNKELGTDPAHEKEFYTSLKKHIDHHSKSGQAFSAIMAGDDDALRFCMKYKESLFPELPIVFYAVNDIAYAKECVKDPLVTGSIEKTYLEETISLAKKLKPEADELILIRDNTPTSTGDWENLKSMQDKYPNMKISDINTQTMTTQEFCDQIGKLNDHSIVLASIAVMDKNGNAMSLLERFNMIGEYANEPVFSCYMHGIGNGCVAGDAMFMRDCGENAAKMIVQILDRGVKPSEIQLKAQGFHRIAIDEKLMQKYGLALDEMPENALILNKTENFWDSYREVLMPLLWIILSLLCILIIILIDGYYVRRAKKNVEYQKNILDALAHEFVSLWYMNASTGDIKLIRDYGTNDTEMDAIRRTSVTEKYQVSMDTFITNYVVEEDREAMRQKTTIEVLLKEASVDEIYSVNFRMKYLDGSINYCRISYARTDDHRGDVHFAYGFHNVDAAVRDEIRKEQQLRDAWRNAYVDNMTEMLNRRAYEERIVEIESEPLSDELAVAVMDVNGLKLANDTLGHSAGDELICGLAQQLKWASEQAEEAGVEFTAYRTGGDEFIVIAGGREELFDRICLELKERIRAWRGVTVRSLQAAIGRVKRTEYPSASIRELIQIADDRMYQAKEEAHRAERQDAEHYPDVDELFAGLNNRDESELLKTALSAFKSEYDHTTGLPGMFYFRTAIAVLNQEIKGHGDRAAVVCLRIQHLSEYNERYGVQAGNELIAQFANQMSKAFGKKNCARSGGNEMFVCAAASTIEERLTEMTARMTHIGREWNTAIHGGIRLIAEAEEFSADAVFDDAREACAKDSGMPGTHFTYFKA